MIETQERISNPFFPAVKKIPLLTNQTRNGSEEKMINSSSSLLANGHLKQMANIEKKIFEVSKESLPSRKVVFNIIDSSQNELKLPPTPGSTSQTNLLKQRPSLTYTSNGQLAQIPQIQTTSQPIMMKRSSRKNQAEEPFQDQYYYGHPPEQKVSSNNSNSGSNNELSNRQRQHLISKPLTDRPERSLEGVSSNNTLGKRDYLVQTNRTLYTHQEGSGIKEIRDQEIGAQIGESASSSRVNSLNRSSNKFLPSQISSSPKREDQSIHYLLDKYKDYVSKNSYQNNYSPDQNSYRNINNINNSNKQPTSQPNNKALERLEYQIDRTSFHKRNDNDTNGLNNGTNFLSSNNTPRNLDFNNTLNLHTLKPHANFNPPPYSNSLNKPQSNQNNNVAEIKYDSIQNSTIKPRNQHSPSQHGGVSSSSLGRDTGSAKRERREFPINNIIKERSKASLTNEVQSSKVMKYHRVPSDLKQSSASPSPQDPQGDQKNFETKKYSFAKIYDGVRGGSSDAPNLKQKGNFGNSPQGVLTNHQLSSQSQSTTLLESTSERERNHLAEQARFLSEITKNPPTIEDFTFLQVLGNGSYAIVRAGIHKKTRFQVAIKSYDKTKLLDPQKKQNVEREVKILSNLNHKNIIKLYKVVESSDCVNLIMEYSPCMPMNKYLKSKVNKKLHEYEARMIFRQLVEAIQYLHKKRVLHRDIKLENILIDQDRQVKLIDFGFSIVLAAQGQKLNMFCGTPTYMSPEIIAKTGYTFPADVWALGVLLIKSLTGNFPFQGATDKELYQNIIKAQIDLPIYISPVGKSLIEKIIKENQEERITPQEILKNDWLEWS